MVVRGQISDAVWGGGVFLPAEDLYNMVEDDSFVGLYRDKGVVWARGNTSIDWFKKVVKKYTLSFATDAVRRGDRLGENYIKNVDPGFGEMPLHSESSFSPICPDVIWFLCVRSPSDRSEATTIADGCSIWKDLSSGARDYFLSNVIEYSLEVELPRVLPAKKWFVDRVGCGQGEIVDGTKLRFVSRRYAVNEIITSRGQVMLAFSNHLFADLEAEKQILNITVSGKRIPQDLLDEANEVSSRNTVDICWESGDVLIINNKRFMHGRRAISSGSQRDIVIAQSEISTL